MIKLLIVLKSRRKQRHLLALSTYSWSSIVGNMTIQIFNNSIILYNETY